MNRKSIVKDRQAVTFLQDFYKKPAFSIVFQVDEYERENNGVVQWLLSNKGEYASFEALGYVGKVTDLIGHLVIDLNIPHKNIYITSLNRKIGDGSKEELTAMVFGARYTAKLLRYVPTTGDGSWNDFVYITLQAGDWTLFTELLGYEIALHTEKSLRDAGKFYLPDALAEVTREVYKRLMSLPLSAGHMGEYELFNYDTSPVKDISHATLSARPFESDEILVAQDFALKELANRTVDIKEKLNWHKILLP